jgi:uncharacterized membrane protein YbjE (DUF340 family)
MTRIIIITITVGALAGYYILPGVFIENSETMLTVFLCLLFVTVGVDLGKQNTIISDIKRSGLRILAIPLFIVIGTFAGGALASVFIDLTMRETLAVSAGFAWYSLAPIILADYSTKLSATSFLANVIREVTAIILIPVVAKYIGYFEAVAPPGAAAMDTCLPVVEKATNSTIAAYSFITGVVLSFMVPISIEVIMNF